MSKTNSSKQQIHDQLVTYNFEPEILDSNGKPSTNVDEADIFSFDFTANGNNYGTVVIVFNDAQELEVFFGDNIGRSMEEADRQEWYDFLYMIRMIAKRNLLSFSIKNISRLKFTMQSMASLKESKLFESYYGTKKVSYSDQPQQTRLVIKHNRTLGEADARFRYIESLFVETADGERFKLPFTKLAGGRAMSRHIAEGGRPYDAFGNHITKTVEDINVLSRFARASQGKTFEGAAGQLVSDALAHYKSLQKKLKHLSSRRGYHTYRENWNPVSTEEQDYDVDGIKRLFVEQNIDQRVETALPLLARLQRTSDVSEDNVVRTKLQTKREQKGKDKYIHNPDVVNAMPMYNPDTMKNVSSGSRTGNEESYDHFMVKPAGEKTAHIVGVTPDGTEIITGTTRLDVATALADAYNRGGFSTTTIERIPMKEADIFEQWATSLVEGVETKQDINDLVQFFDKEQPLGADAIDVITQISDIINDDALFTELKLAAEVDPDQDARPIVKDWVVSNQFNPELEDTLAPIADQLSGQDAPQDYTNDDKGTNMSQTNDNTDPLAALKRNSGLGEAFTTVAPYLAQQAGSAAAATSQALGNYWDKQKQKHNPPAKEPLPKGSTPRSPKPTQPIAPSPATPDQKSMPLPSLPADSNTRIITPGRSIPTHMPGETRPGNPGDITMDPLDRSSANWQTNAPGQKYQGRFSGIDTAADQEKDIADLKKIPGPQTYSMKYNDQGEQVFDSEDPLNALKRNSGLEEANIVPGGQGATATQPPAQPTKTQPAMAAAQSDFEKEYRRTGNQVSGQKYTANKDTSDMIQQQDKNINDLRTDFAKDAAKRFSMSYDDEGEREPIPQLVSKQESADPALARLKTLAGQ